MVKCSIAKPTQGHRLELLYKSPLSVSSLVGWMVDTRLSFGFLIPEDGPIGCTEMSVRNYHHSLCNNPEEQFSTRYLF